MNKRRKILFSVNGFPAKSETFIVNHIVAAIDSGMDVSILANHKQPLEAASQQDIVLKYNLLDKVIEKPLMPKSKLARLSLALKMSIKDIKAFMYFLALLNPFKFGLHNFNLNAFFELYPVLKLTHFDIYHAHFGQNAMGIALAKEFGIIQAKLITTFHGYDAGYANQQEKQNLIQNYKYVFKWSHVITTNTPFLQNILKDLGCKNSVILPMSIDTDFFQPEKMANNNDNNKTINFISVGRLVPFKCHYLGIQAVNTLLKKDHAIKYTIIGSGPEHNNLKALINKYNIENHVFLANNKSQQEIKDLFLQSHVFLMTSNFDENGRRETQGVVTIEAQACGLPVVAFNSGGVPYTLVNNKTGFLVDEMDIENYTNKLEILITNESLRNNFGDHARRFVLENYSNLECNKKLSNLYKD